MIKKSDKFFTVFGILMIGSEFGKQWVLTGLNNHQYDWWYLPFQLCSIPMYLLVSLLIIRAEPARRIIYTFLMDYCLLCGVFVFFDVSGMIYPTAALTTHSFLYHLVMIVTGMIAGLSGKADYSFKGFLKCSLIFAAGCIIATLLNVTLNKYGTINMFYISPYYKMNQIVFRTIARRLGNLVGISLYITAIFSGALLFHIIWAKINTRSEL